MWMGGRKPYAPRWGKRERTEPEPGDRRGKKTQSPTKKTGLKGGEAQK